MQERTADPIEEVQLDFFGMDRIRLGEGYAALAKLELDRAASIFNELILANPDFVDAKQGYVIATAWSEILWELETRCPQDAVAFLWEKIQTYAFGQWCGGLRTALVRKVIGLIDCDVYFFISPDFCLGYLLFEMADYEQAEKAYRFLTEKKPNNAKLICGLGNSIFLQKRLFEARYCYAQALLTSPLDVDPNGLEDTELKRIVKECGVYMAPVYGWLRGALPLLDSADIQANDKKHSQALMIYRSVFLAESARNKRDHHDMVEKRRNLKDIAPKVFEEYITHLV